MLNSPSTITTGRDISQVGGCQEYIRRWCEPFLSLIPQLLVHLCDQMLPQCSPELAPYRYKGLNVKNSSIPSLFAGVLLCSREHADFCPPSKIFRIIFIIYTNTLIKSQPFKISHQVAFSCEQSTPGSCLFVLKLTGKQAFRRERTDSFHITQGSKSGRSSTMTKKGSTLIQHPRSGGGATFEGERTS